MSDLLIGTDEEKVQWSPKEERIHAQMANTRGHHYVRVRNWGARRYNQQVAGAGQSPGPKPSKDSKLFQGNESVFIGLRI